MSITRGLQANLAFDEALPEPPGDAPRLQAWEPQDWAVADDWQPVIARFLSSETGQQLRRFISARLAAHAIIYPPEPLRALRLTALAQIKVVILGQDPYHGPGQAEGLAFSVPDGIKLPPSLRNIFKELAQDPSMNPAVRANPLGGSLTCWARQGVLLLNTCLTVERGQAASHAGRGWEILTDQIVCAVAAQAKPVVFLLWGAHAQAKLPLIQAHSTPGVPRLILSANHPSPLSAGRAPTPFLGCGHFGQVNRFLDQHHISRVNWHCLTQRH